jgi:hypothetical protein
MPEKQPFILGDGCHHAVGPSGAVLYPKSNGRSHFPEVVAYCTRVCLDKGLGAGGDRANAADRGGMAGRVAWPV